jgi:L-ascorbate 6-phosphate lactonase
MSSTLRDKIAGSTPASGVDVWWLGQAGVVLRGSGASVAIDPFLTDYGGFGRLYDPPIAPDQVDFLDLLLGTHDHIDHIDPLGFPALLDASPEAIGIVPAAVLPRVSSLVGDSSRLLGARVDSMIEHSGVTVAALPAVHANEPNDGYDFHLTADGEYPFLGYVVELDGVRICHTGDTLIYDGLLDRLRTERLDLLILPINGASWFREQRGLVGNMNVFEAAELAAASGVPIAMPVHWDLFADNTEDPEHFARYAASRHPGVRVVIPTIGCSLHLDPS